MELGNTLSVTLFIDTELTPATVDTAVVVTIGHADHFTDHRR